MRDYNYWANQASYWAGKMDNAITQTEWDNAHDKYEQATRMAEAIAEKEENEIQTAEAAERRKKK